MKKAKKLAPVLTAFLAVVAVACTLPESVNASANSGPSSWSGVTASGAVITGENCPVEVESEILTFNIPDFIDHSSTTEQLKNYGSVFSAEYTFKNPTPNTVTATLAFPLGTLSGYGYYEVENPDDGTSAWQDSFVKLEDVLADKYKVLVDGQEIAAQARYTFHSRNSFDFTKESKQLYDGFRRHGFFSREMPVYKYKIIISSDETDNFNAELTFNTADNVRIAGTYGSINLGNRKTTVKYYVENGSEINLYSIGGELDLSSAKWDFYKWSGYWGLNYKDVKARAELVPEVEIKTFENYVFEGYTGGNGLIKSDYYNAVLDYIDFYLDDSMLPEGFDFLNGSSNYIMNWLVYDLNFVAGQTLKNTVTAPVFSGGLYYYTPYVYTYEYLLSPAQNWNNFKSLEIRVVTPHYLLGGSLNFEKTDYGYCYKSDGLPKEELTFEMCTVENPVNTRKNAGRGLAVALIGIFAIPVVICSGLAIFGIAVLATAGKKKTISSYNYLLIEEDYGCIKGTENECTKN